MFLLVAVGFKEPYYMQQSTRTISQQSKCQTVHKTKLSSYLSPVCVCKYMSGREYIHEIILLQGTFYRYEAYIGYHTINRMRPKC